MNAYTTVSDGNISLTGVAPLYPYILFNKSPLQLRRIGALGGKAHGRNQRARRAQMPTPPQATPLGSAPRQSTAEAVAALDAQFPWLCSAEKRPARKLPPTRCAACAGSPDKASETSRNPKTARVPRKGIWP